VGRQHVYGPPGATASGLPSIGDLLLGRRSGVRVDRARGRAITRLIEAAGVRPATAERMVGQLLLAPRPYAEGPGWQDFLAGHQVQTQQVRRVRFYLAARAAPAQRDMIMRAAEREYRILQDIHHDGIVDAVDMVEHALGPAVVFEHEEDSVRLDRWMDEHGGSLGIDQRLALVRQLAETMRYAHSRRLVHRNLNPRSILVKRPDSTRPRLVMIDWQTGGRLPGSSQPSAGGPGTLGGTILIEQLADEAARVYQAPEIGYTDVSGPLLDVFALGALAYLIFTGRPPAAGVAEMRTRLAEAGGLDVSAAFDAPPTSLVDLVYDATLGAASGRTASVAAALLAAPQYRRNRQLKLAGQPTLPDDRVAALLAALVAAGGRQRMDALAAHAGVPAQRIANTVTVLRRLLSVEGYQSVTVDSDGQTVVLDERMLRDQFGLGGV
jgi:hypothetical protein